MITIDVTADRGRRTSRVWGEGATDSIWTYVRRHSIMEQETRPRTDGHFRSTECWECDRMEKIGMGGPRERKIKLCFSKNKSKKTEKTQGARDRWVGLKKTKSNCSYCWIRLWSAVVNYKMAASRSSGYRSDSGAPRKRCSSAIPMSFA